MGVARLLQESGEGPLGNIYVAFCGSPKGGRSRVQLQLRRGFRISRKDHSSEPVPADELGPKVRGSGIFYRLGRGRLRALILRNLRMLCRVTSDEDGGEGHYQDDARIHTHFL